MIQRELEDSLQGHPLRYVGRPREDINNIFLAEARQLDHWFLCNGTFKSSQTVEAARYIRDNWVRPERAISRQALEAYLHRAGEQVAAGKDKNLVQQARIGAILNELRLRTLEGDL